MNHLIETIKIARVGGSFLRLRKKLIDADFLIIDDLRIKPLKGKIVQEIYDLLEECYLKFHVIEVSNTRAWTILTF